MSVLSFEKQSTIESKSLMSVWWDGVFPAIPFHFLECWVIPDVSLKWCYLRYWRRKSISAMRKDLIALDILSGGHTPMRTFPLASCTLKFWNLPAINNRTTWHRERLTTSFGGKTQEELEVGLQEKWVHQKTETVCSEQSNGNTMHGTNVSHICN